MRPILAELLDLLRLEAIEVNLFRGQSQDLGWGAVFGGQVLGQALSAAAHTVPPERTVHSLHAYFLRQGDARRPIVYEVDRIRDGRSFTTRRVVAVQGGRAIFSLSASFQVAEAGLEHQDVQMPDVPAPEDVVSDQEALRRRADELPEVFRTRALADRPIEARSVEPLDILAPEVRPPVRRVWIRAVDALPDDPAVHHYLLAYASDFSLLTTALLPHGLSWVSPRMQVASLDHAMWFARPFRMDDWLLYVIDGPTASGGRALVRGSFFDRSGRLVASTAQEGLIRRWPER
ncbi:MAG: acyl-CoA thioesterase II [Myxococcota bacterium]